MKSLEFTTLDGKEIVFDGVRYSKSSVCYDKSSVSNRRVIFYYLSWSSLVSYLDSP